MCTLYMQYVLSYNVMENESIYQGAEFGDGQTSTEIFKPQFSPKLETPQQQTSHTLPRHTLQTLNPKHRTINPQHKLRQAGETRPRSNLGKERVPFLAFRGIMREPLNPKPYTLNPKPQTPRTKRETRADSGSQEE